MTEEHQLGPNEQNTLGIVEPLFDAVCGGCHGSVSGQEIDVVVSPDALTGASQSLSAGTAPDNLECGAAGRRRISTARTGVA